jgi:hypothetical protein
MTQFYYLNLKRPAELNVSQILNPLLIWPHVTLTWFLIGRSNYRVTWVEVCILIIAVFIGVASFLATLITCCLHDR